MYNRLIKPKLEKKLFKGKALIIVGARQTGKTFLVNQLIDSVLLRPETVFFNGDNPSDRDSLNNKDSEFLHALIGSARVIVIDEGQKIKSIGQTAKLLVDRYGNSKQIIITGSSSIHLLYQTEEPLTGRKLVFTLYPLSLPETYGTDYQRLLKELESILIFGQYPEVAAAATFNEKRETLRELERSYLYKDVLELKEIKYADAIANLLRALALQIGAEVSYTEVSRLVGLDKKTVERYVNLLEQAHIIFRLPPFAGNRRNAIAKRRKIYFCDLGIRNMLVNNFNFLNQRADAGALWENLLVAERLKWREYNDIYANQFFWRTYTGQEVDLVEEREGKLFGYEFKWNERRSKVSAPGAWQEIANTSYAVITKLNLKGFIL